MEKFWEYVLKISAIMGILLFWKSWGENMKSIKLFWENLTPWQFMFFLILLVIFFSLWRWRLNVNENKDKKNSLSPKALINSNNPIEIIKRPEGHHYLLQGGVCSHIPDPPTFEYLGRFFGFSWFNAKPMSFDDIKANYIIGEQLPSILPHCPKQ